MTDQRFTVQPTTDLGQRVKQLEEQVAALADFCGDLVAMSHQQERFDGDRRRQLIKSWERVARD
jgi:hypothetical protein